MLHIPLCSIVLGSKYTKVPPSPAPRLQRLEGEGLNIFQGKNSIKKNYGLKIVDAKMIGDDVKIIYTRNAN